MFPRKVELFNFLFFLQWTIGKPLSHKRIISTAIWPSLFSSFLWIHFDWTIQTAFFSQMSQLIIKSSHVICRFAFLFPLLEGFNDCFVFCEFRPTGTSPGTGKAITLLAFFFCTFSRETIMFFERMLTQTFEVISSVRRNIVEALTFTFRSFARCFFCFVS